MPDADSPLHIREEDLKGACYRLNTALQILVEQIARASGRAVASADTITWNPLVLDNGWTDSGGSLYGYPAWAIVGVTLLIRGFITGGTITDFTNLFTLPPQARPERRQVAPCSSIAVATYGVVSVRVQPDGFAYLTGAVVGTTDILLSLRVPMV